MDIFLCLKFALMYVTAANIFDVLDKEKMRAWGTGPVEIFTVFLGIIAILDMVFHIFPTPDFRYGFYSRMLFFSHSYILFGLPDSVVYCLYNLFKRIK